MLTLLLQLYAITDLTAVFNTRIVALPVAGIFQQAMRSQGGSFALLFLFFLDQIINLPGAYIVAGRMLWTLVCIAIESISILHILRSFCLGSTSPSEKALLVRLT